jgi:NTE family protein
MRANAVFSGGGIKGIGLAGALEVAQGHGFVWEKLAGTSVGALLAALVASGYRAEEIYELIRSFDFSTILDGDFQRRLLSVGVLANIFLEKGIYRGRALENWTRSLLEAKGISTFGDLGKNKLSIIAADLTMNRMLVLPQDLVQYHLVPEDFSVAKAVRMSMSLPFFFEPVLLKYGKSTSYIVDGGLVSNYPIWLFQSQDLPTIGFRLQDEDSPKRVRNMWDYVQAIISTTIGGHDRRALSKVDHARTITVPTLGIGTVDFELTTQQKERLYRAGKKAAEIFFTKDSGQSTF